MKVLITGYVFNERGKLEGTVDLPGQEAERLLALGVAVSVDDKTEDPDSEDSGISEEAGPKRRRGR